MESPVPNLTARSARLTTYDTLFHQYTANTSGAAAQRISQVVRAILPVRSVLDVGCAYGTWLAAWRAGGVEDVFGVDGPWVDTTRLQIPADRFAPHNLEQAFALQRRFDLVESLEVAEHLPAACAAAFVDNLAAHGDAVLFSAAPPGQGGENHVNEQPYDYWRALFQARGFIAVDCIRPAVAGDNTISVWYRYNILLYVRPVVFESLPEYVQLFRLENNAPVPDVAPWAYRSRRAMVRMLPRPVQFGLARGLAHWHGRK